MELRQLEEQLIATYDHKDVKEILVKIAVLNLGTTVWSINPQWELPIPLQSVLKSLPRGSCLQCHPAKKIKNINLVQVFDKYKYDVQSIPN